MKKYFIFLFVFILLGLTGASSASAQGSNLDQCSNTTLGLEVNPTKVTLNSTIQVTASIRPTTKSVTDRRCLVNTTQVQAMLFRLKILKANGDLVNEVIKEFQVPVNVAETIYKSGSINPNSTNAFNPTDSFKVYGEVYYIRDNGGIGGSQYFKLADKTVTANFAKQQFGCLSDKDSIYVCGPTPDFDGVESCSSEPTLIDTNLCGHGPQVMGCVDANGIYRCEGVKPSDGSAIPPCAPDSKPRMITQDQCNKASNDTAAIVAAANGSTTGKFIPSCVNIANGGAFLQSECGDITIFLKLGINIIDYLFGIIGGVALLFFVYGGVIFILSQGNSDKVQQGKSIILAAVLGIIVAFSGYALVRFVGDVIGIKSAYKLNQ